MYIESQRLDSQVNKVQQILKQVAELAHAGKVAIVSIALVLLTGIAAYKLLKAEFFPETKESAPAVIIFQTNPPSNTTSPPASSKLKSSYQGSRTISRSSTIQKLESEQQMEAPKVVDEAEPMREAMPEFKSGLNTKSGRDEIK